MKLRKAIKKVFALGTGVTMLGATVLGAMAADLADYPNQFIKDGKFDGLMVVGAAAKTEDVLGVVDIATSLQYSSKTESVVNTKGGGSTVSLTGDVVSVSYGSDLLEIGELLGDVRETLTEYDLAALSGGTVKSDAGSTNYNQYLRFEFTDPSDNTGTEQSGWVVFDEDEYDEVGDYLYFKDGGWVFEYELEFEEGAESDVETAAGVELTSGNGNLNDLEDEQISIMGKTYSIVKAEVWGIEYGAAASAVTSQKIRLTLLGGDVVDTLKEQETKTYTIDGKDYEVTVLIISDSGSSSATVKFQVNGEVTSELRNSGDTDTLSDGTTIGIRDILANEGTEVAGDDIVEFYLGANKMVLTDANYTDDSYDAAGVEIEEENIEDASAKIIGSMGSSEFKINSISYALQADAPRGHVYIKPGEGLRQYLDEPEGMFGVEWDIRYEGLEDHGMSVFEIDPSGDESFDMRFTNNEGLDYTLPYLDNSNDDSFGLKWGDSDNGLWWQENASLGDNAYNILEDDYFIVNKNSSLEKSFTHVLTFDNVDTTNRILSFTDLATGQKEVTYSVTGTPAAGANTVPIVPTDTSASLYASGDLIVGGTTFKVYIAKRADNNYVLAVDHDGSGSLAAQGEANIIIDGGGIVDLGSQIATAGNATDNSKLVDGNCVTGTVGSSCYVNITLTTLSKEFDENDGNEVLSINVYEQTTANKVDLDVENDKVGSTAWAYWKFKSLKGSDKKQGMTKYGAFVEEIDDDTGNDADALYIEYPYQQRGAQVFVASGATQKAVSESGSGAVTTTSVQRIQVGKSVLDTTVSSVSKDNLIVVGGPCVNTVAATLMGNPANCVEGFEEGKAIIKLFENGNKVAMLVAGYSAADSRRAAQVVANYQDYADDLKGDEVVVSGTGLTVTDISAPAPMVEETVEE